MKDENNWIDSISNTFKDIVKDSYDFIDMKYNHDETGEIYIFQGIVLDKEDFYYLLYNEKNNSSIFLSCVVSLEMAGYNLMDSRK